MTRASRSSASSGRVAPILDVVDELGRHVLPHAADRK
jgi:hypothetical protein